MLSKKTKYALKALLYLTHQDELVQISEIARRESLPMKFLEAILLELRKHGILYSKRGSLGGYSLAKSPNEITFGQVIRILDGPLVPIHCVSVTSYSKCAECCSKETCELRLIMEKVRDQITDILDSTTLENAFKYNGQHTRRINAIAEIIEGI
ncbi:MAG TPA: Rrf2 family transcriptional regulator [Cytophagaceae bacterium]|jgi:Rrf2 family protein